MTNKPGMRVTNGGATAYLRHIPSARQHIDWHWGLISQCRYFPGKRIDEGRGYWPNYWMPNPETAAHFLAFVQDKELPPEGAHPAAQKCPY